MERKKRKKKGKHEYNFIHVSCLQKEKNSRNALRIQDMKCVSRWFCTATHIEYSLPLLITSGYVADAVNAAIRLPMLMGGSLVSGSFSAPLPTSFARNPRSKTL